MESFKWANYTRPLTDEEKKTGMLNLSIMQQVEIKNYCRQNAVAEFLAENHDERAFEDGVLSAASEIVDDQEESNISEDQAISYYLEQNEIEDREIAIKNIDKFCKSEYGEDSNGDFTNLRKIPLAYTEGGLVFDDENLDIEDMAIPVQVEVDLINHSLETYYDEKHVQTVQYDSVQDMNCELLEGMIDFDSLVSCSDFSEQEVEESYRVIYDYNKKIQTKPLISNLVDEGKYYSGIINLDCYIKPIPFDYNKENERLDLHNNSEPGWMTGASYEKELTPFIQANWSKIFDDVSCVLNDKNKVSIILNNQKAAVDKGGK